MPTRSGDRTVAGAQPVLPLPVPVRHIPFPPFPMSDPFIRLDQFMKLQNLVQTGGHAKILIQSGQVEVNGETETRRGKKLVSGDQVTFEQQTYTVSL